MDARLQLRVQRYGWDAASTVYDDAWREHLKPAHEAMLAMADLAPGHEVVETAAGSGLVTFPVARAVTSDGRVTATDMSEKMVATGAERAAELGLDHVSFDRQNAEDLTFDSARFDRALCALGLMYIPNPVAALSDMARVLQPGGRATVSVWGQRKNCGWAEIFPIVDARVKSEVCPMFFGLGAPNALKSTMDRCGFEAIEEQRLTTALTFPDGDSVLTAVIDGGPVALATKRFDEETRAEVDAEFLESLADHRTDDGYAIPGEFVIATGVVPDGAA